MKLGNQEITWEQVRHILLWIALPLILGALIAAALPRPVIGVIYLNDAIYSYSARDMITQINYAREHPEIRAVVLAIDSPGGTVADTEAVYLELLRLRATKPVVTSVGSMSASGAYYLSVGSDYIFARPTSEVGNVGVIGYLPPAPFIFEDIVSTGPYKLWGSPRDTLMREMEMIKQSFYQAVRLGRGDRLQVGPEIILRGQIWPGSEALRMGLIDALGSESEAVEKAASLAHVGNYQTADLRELAGIQTTSYPFFFQSPEGISMPYPKEPGIYLLYVPPLPVGK
ncbi:MAG: S49 family peptidase [Anaerolineales bacterium]|nr:S49 family peptidase [Anaerolineales bacterium]